MATPAKADAHAQTNSTIVKVNFCQKPAGSKKTNGAANPQIHSKKITIIHTTKIHSLLVLGMLSRRLESAPESIGQITFGAKWS